MLSVVKLNVVMLSVVKLSVVAPQKSLEFLEEKTLGKLFHDAIFALA
jgi:hypothetical protein